MATETLPAVPKSALAIRLFGSFEVWIAGSPLRPLRTRKGEWLLALLALRVGGSVDRAWLAGTLWPESIESQAFYNLRRSLTDLRHALGREAGRLLSPSPHTLALDLSGAAVDVIDFDAAIARGDPGSLERAVELYRGPLLGGVTDEWVFQERQVREQAYLSALETLATGALSRGEPAAADRHLRRAVTVDPLRESAQRALMQALAAGGSYAAALQTYRELRLLLHRELNAGPDPETQALFQRIRAEARCRSATVSPPMADGTTPVPRPSPPRAYHHNLPCQFSRFVGRAAEMREVDRLLGSSRLVTLTGCGGCGKTRLALEIGADSIAEFTDGVWLADLAPVLDGALVPQAVATALGVQAEPARPLLDTVLDGLRPRSVLLLLDNCEHLLGACAQLAELLLHGCPGLRILATSREALGLPGETTYRVPCLSVPDPKEPLSTDALLQSEAVRLFVDRASAALPSFVLTEQNGPALARVCRHLDGIPLAIELAAVRVRTLPVERIAARMDDRFQLLTEGGRTALPRHRTLKGMIDWSYELLSEAERTLLLRLSVFVGGWTSEAAEAIGSGSPLEAGNVSGLLSALVEKSLVVFEEHDGAERYRFLETVRQYALDRLTGSSEALFVRESHRHWYLRLAEQAEAERRSPRQSGWVRRLEAEHDNLRAALDFAHACPEGVEAELRLATALAWFWDVHNHWHEGLQRLEGALARSGDLSAALRARGLVALGHLAWGERDDRRARTAARDGLTLFREVGDQQGAGWALYTLGLASRQIDPAQALTSLEQAQALFQAAGDEAGVALSVFDQGTTAYRQQDYARAGALEEEGLARLRALGDTRSVAAALGGLGYCRRQQGDLEGARALTAESLALFQELGDRLSVAWTSRSLAHLHRYLGDLEQAAQLYQQSVSLCREAGRPHELAHGLVGLGDVALGRGDLEEAVRRYVEGLEKFQQHGSEVGIPWLLEKFAGIAALRGHGERAARLLGAAEALREILGVALPPVDRSDYYDRQLLTTRSLLSEDAFAAAWKEGRALTLEQAIAEALVEAPPDHPFPSTRT
jgi:predicted ATPase/DNA-binding SARP family transcriptional activator